MADNKKGPSVKDLFKELRKSFYGLPPSGLTGNPLGDPSQETDFTREQARAISAELLRISDNNPELSAQEAVALLTRRLDSFDILTPDAQLRLEVETGTDTGTVETGSRLEGAFPGLLDDPDAPQELLGGDSSLAEELEAAGYRETTPGSQVWVNALNGDTIDLNAAGGDDPLSRFATREQLSARFPSLTPEEIEAVFRDQFGGLDESAANQPRPLNPIEIELMQAQIDQLGLLIDPNRLQVRPDGTLFDPATGTIHDPTSFGLARDVFVEGTRQFNEQLRFDRETLTETTRRFDESESRLRARLGLDTATQLGDLGLRLAADEADILRNPADFVARSFRTRGEKSPFPEVFQADLINRAREQLGGALDAAGAAAGGGTEELPPPQTRFDVSGETGALQDDGLTHLTGAQDVFNAAQAEGLSTEQADILSRQQQLAERTAGDAPNLIKELLAKQIKERAAAGGVETTGTGIRFAHGGTTRAKRLIVGDSPDGLANPEVIENPEGKPLRITSSRFTKDKSGKGVPRFAFGTETEDISTSSPRLSGTRTRFTQPARTPGAGSISSLDRFRSTLNLAPTTQGEIRGAEERARPPAVRSLLQGERPARLRFNQFPLFTPQQLGDLTDDEIPALQTTLATQFGESLNDVLKLVERRFGPTRSFRQGRLRL